jgi:hypothetical protein
MKVGWIHYVSILLPILLIAILLYPFWRTTEGFKSTKEKVEFKGKRWTTDEFTQFQEAIQGAKPKLETLQDELFVVLEDYKRVMDKLENGAYKQKEAIDDISKDLSQKERDQIIKTSGLSKTPVKDFYKPLYEAKQSGSKPITVRAEHNFQRTLPRVSIPTLGAFGEDGGLSWINRGGNTKERYDAEEEFYKSVPVYLPTFQSSVNEVLMNAEILRANAGESSWGMRPRVERMKAIAEQKEKEIKEKTNGNEEGFESKSCPKSIRIRTIQTIPYEKWGTMANDIRTKLDQIRLLITKSTNDIKFSEGYLEETERKGRAGRDKARNAARN